MFKNVKRFLLNMLAGANVAVALLMVLVGWSGHLHPAEHPMLSCVGLTFPLFILLNLAFLVVWVLFSPKRIFIPLLAFAISFLHVRTYIPINFKGGDVPEGAFKVLSFNVKGFMSNTDEKTGIATRPALSYVLNSDADIVCLQEIGVTTFLTDSIKGHYAYSDSCRNGAKGSILTLLSKYPIVKKEVIAYPSESNSSGAFYVKKGADTLLVINNHFEKTGLSREDRMGFHDMVEGTVATDTVKAESRRLIVVLGEAARIRSKQVDAVARYIREHSQYPIILCGDFNDSPISYTHHVLAGLLTDCFVATGTGLGWTYTDSRMYVRIDNILCSSHFTPYKCTVDNQAPGSDHYPIACWLKNTSK